MKRLVNTRSPFFVQFESLPAEGAATNLVHHSEDFNSWSNKTNATITSNVYTAPNGTLTGDRIEFSTTDTASRVEDPTTGFTVSTKYTVSVYLKTVSLSSATVRIGTSGSTSGEYEDVTITNEWQRFSTVITASSTTEYPRVQNIGGIDGLVIAAWGYQVEEGTQATSYVATDGSTESRVATTEAQEETVTAEVRIWEGSGGYDFERTNLIAESEDFTNTGNATTGWTGGSYGSGSITVSNNNLDPLGGYNAYRFDISGVASGNNGALHTHDDYNGTRFADAGDYTISVWLKGAVGGEIVPLAFRSRVSQGADFGDATLTTEWVRYTFTYTKGTYSVTNGGFQFRFYNRSDISDQTFYAFGAQIEKASIMTDYISSTGGATTVYAGENDRPTNANYTIQKEPTNGKTTFEVSELIRDYISQTSEQSTGGTFFEVKLYDSVNPIHFIETYYATEGYVEGYEGLQTYNSVNANTQFLISNRTVFIPEGESMDVPVYGDYDTANGDFYLLYEGASPVGGGQYFSALENAPNQINYITLDSDNSKVVLYENSTSIDTITVEVPECSKYDNHKLIYVNKFGAKQEMFFNMKTIERVRTQADGFNRNVIDYNNLTLNNGKHSYKKRIKMSNEIYTLNTGFVSEDNVQAFEELILSEYVWLQKSGEDARPVNVETSSMTRKSHLNDGLIQFEIEVKSNESLISTVR